MSSRRTIGSAVPAANSGWRISMAAIPRGSVTGSVSNFSDSRRFAYSRSAGDPNAQVTALLTAPVGVR